MSYGNLGGSRFEQRTYPESLKFYEKAVDIFEMTLSEKHPDIQIIKNRIEDVKKAMEE